MVRKEDRRFTCEVNRLKNRKDNPNIVNDIQYAALRMNEMDISKKPKRIECTDEIYNRIRSLIWLRLKSCNESIFHGVIHSIFFFFKRIFLNGAKKI